MSFTVMAVLQDMWPRICGSNPRRSRQLVSACLQKVSGIPQSLILSWQPTPFVAPPLHHVFSCGGLGLLDYMRNEEVLLQVNEQRNILHAIRKRRAKWIGHILRRNCLLRQVIEGNIKGEMEVTRRQGRRRKKLLDDLKDRGRYSHLKEEALNSTVWRNRFGGGFGHVIRQTAEWMNVSYAVCVFQHVSFEILNLKFNCKICPPLGCVLVIWRDVG